MSNYGSSKEGGENESSRKKRNSFLDIQAEQVREQQQQQQQQQRPSQRQYRRGDSASSSNSRTPQNGGNSRRSSGSMVKGPVNRDNLPIEQGTICSMKDSFGFVHCADRPEELFFHYSEVVGIHPDELELHDELEFRVGRAATRANSNSNRDSGSGNDSPKMAAYQIRKLAPGTIVWETEDNPGVRVKGVVERSIRTDDRRGGGGGGRGSFSNQEEGNIRLLAAAADSGVVPNTEEQETQEKNEKEQTLVANGPLVQFLASDIVTSVDTGTPSDSGGARPKGGTRLYKGDLVEFSIVTSRRTKRKYAKDISLLQSERERSRDAKEKKLLETATAEEGVVKSLKNDYGFLRSNKRREDIYFHYSHVIVPDSGGSSNGEDFLLKEGQEMKFLVVMETDSNSNMNNVPGGNPTNKRLKYSARQLQCLPKGSVMFHSVVARGVLGVVTQCPQPPGSAGQNDERDGTVCLLDPIQVPSDNSCKTLQTSLLEEPSTTIAVESVGFRFGDAPGGVVSYQQRGSSVFGLWVSEGDTLLFDVVKETFDGSYRVAPTSYLTPPASTDNGGSAAEAPSEGVTAAVRLVGVSMAGRAEGVIHTIKESGGYGFIHFAERPVDVHFKVYDVLPNEIQADLLRNMGYSPHSSEENSNQPFNMQVGASVQFDLGAHGTVTSPNARGRGGRSGRANGHERENLKAQRLIILPPTKPVTIEKVLASGVKGTVKSEDLKQLYAGYIELEDAVEPMSMEERHPLISRMISDFLEESARPSGRNVLVFREVWSLKEDDVVVELVKTLGNGLLSCTHIPVPGLAPHPGRLCIRRLREVEEANAAYKSDDGMDEETNKDGSSSGKKNKKKGAKPTNISNNKTLRYDKSNLVDDLKEDVPPGPGDVVMCDIVQSRRTGKVSIHNMRMVERKERDPINDENLATTTSGVGIVKEVLPNRNFGLINVLDETATKRELLFFHLSSVASSSNGSGGNSNKGQIRMLQKGDEVKFDIGVEKNGKQVALNVQVLPKGAIPSKESKNACRGILLMEPSHTSLSDTPVRNKQGLNGNNKAAGGLGGRWNQDKDDGQKKSHQHQEIVEEGYILLTEDKSGMFTRPRDKSPKRGTSPKRGASPKREVSPKRGTSPKRGVSPKRDASPNPTKEGESTVGTATTEIPQGQADGDKNLDVGGIPLCSHLTYKNGGIAIHGAGAASCVDGSTHPRRGDLVSFVRAKSGRSVRDIRVVARQAANLVRGRLENIVRVDTVSNGAEGGRKGGGTAKFIAATESQEEYEIDLSDVVSCDIAILKDKETVEGILYNGKIYGVCRTVDLYLESKLGASHKERPKLNLTVKKDRGGTIMAQSMMAKGPDGTNGFTPGWTARVSRFAGPREATEVADEASPPPT